MASRLRKVTSKAPSPTGYRRLLRWAALPVTDRRWAAPLSAVALGFGLFVGVAIGPGAAGTFATGAAQIIEIPGFAEGGDGDGGNDGASPLPSANAGGGDGGESSAPVGEPALPMPSPIVASEGEGEAAETTQPSSSQESPSPTEEPKPDEETLAGIVLHANPAAASYTIAEPAGTLDVVHAAKAPQPGTKVSVPVRPLANGTFAEAGARTKAGVRTRATFSGVVTYADPTPAAPAYTVSKRGISALVHVRPDPAGTAPTLPALGAFVSVAVDIEKPPPPVAASELPVPTGESPTPLPPAEPSAPAEPVPAVPPPAPEPAPSPPQPTCAPDPSQPSPAAIRPGAILWQRQVKSQGSPFAYGDFAGIVEAVCPESGQLLLSADDIRESGHDLVFAVPATLDASKLQVGQSVLATATIAPDGSLSLTGLASDERTRGADDAKAAQGELAPSKSEATGAAVPRPARALARAAPPR